MSQTNNCHPPGLPCCQPSSCKGVSWARCWCFYSWPFRFPTACREHGIILTSAPPAAIDLPTSVGIPAICSCRKKLSLGLHNFQVCQPPISCKVTCEDKRICPSLGNSMSSVLNLPAFNFPISHILLHFMAFWTQPEAAIKAGTPQEAFLPAEETIPAISCMHRHIRLEC